VLHSRHTLELVERRRRWLWLLCSVTVAVWLLSLATTMASSWLLANHPLLLVTLDGRNRHLLLAADRVDPALLLVVVVSLRRLATDPAYFALGRLLDDESTRWVESRVPSVNRASRSFREAPRVP
jgi:hypothetical protein